MLCVSMIPRDATFKFYSQDCLRHAFFTSCNGPSDISADVYENKTVPADKVLVLLRDMCVRASVCIGNNVFVCECVRVCVRARGFCECVPLSAYVCVCV
jgi:hypothetical protein